MLNSPFTIDHSQPISFIIPNAALSSLDIPGLEIMDTPFLTNAAAQARCIELLEAAATIDPLTTDGLTRTITL